MSTRDSSYTGSDRILRGRRRGSLLATVAVGLATLAAGQAAHAADVTITVDAGKQLSGNPRFWATCVGTGTASLTLRPDLQTHYKIANRELGMMRVRGHGVLNDDMGVYKGAGSYDWTKFDKYLAAIKTANMQPFIELSFMPTALASSGNDRNPPKDYATYQKFIQAVVQHTIDKYGAEEVSKWYWEVWNEWNYSGFWTGTMEDYHELYKYAVAGATAALPKILIGGPVTTQGSVEQMTAFIKYVKSNNLRFTFLSSHAYPGGEGPDADPNFAVTDNNDRVKVITDAGYTTDEIPSFNTEWNSSWAGQGGKTEDNLVSMDNHVNAPFILKTVKLMAEQVKGDKPPLEIFSYWTVSDVFDEYSGGPSGSYILSKNGTLPFGSVFGLMTFQGMRKAAFNGFKMLTYLGDKRVQVSGGTGSKDGVDGMATVSSDGSQVQIIVYNYYATIKQSGSDNVTVKVNNLPLAGKEAYVTRFAIDETHTNPYSVWAEQSKPTNPSEANWQAMRKVQHLMPVEPIEKKTLEDSYTATLTVPKQGAAMIILSLKRPLTGRDAKVEIEGEDYDGQSGVTKEDSADESMGQAISATANGWVYFENVDYSDAGVDSVQLRVKNAAETSVELRSESETGTVLGKCTLPAASSWETQTCKLSAPVTGVSKLYLMFAGAARLNWLKFTGAGGTPTGGSGGNSGTSAGGSGGNSGTSTGGGKGGSIAGGSTGGGAGGSGGAKSSGTTSSAGSSGGSSSSSSKASGGSAGKSSSSGSSSGGSSSSRSSDSSGGSSGQSSSRGSSSSASSGSSSGCGCRVGGTGRGSQGAFSLFGLLLGVLALRRRHDWVRASRACIALLAAACGSNSESGAGSQGGSTASAGQSGGKSTQVSSGGAGGASSAVGGSSSQASSGLGGKTESGGSSATAGSKGGTTATGCKGCSTGGTGGGKTGTGGSGGTGMGTGGTTTTTGNGGTASGTAGQGGTAGAGTGGSTSNPPPTLSLVTTKQGAEWKTDGQLKEVTTGSADVTVNDGSPLQDWEGFGAAFNEMGWNYLSTLSEADKGKALDLLFAADGVNFAWGRIPMGATDYAMDRYTLNETENDTSMSKFSIDRDKQKLIPFVQAAKTIKTDMRFWASPWTPPTWLKDGPFNDKYAHDGGKMKTDATSLKALADYFVKFVQAYGELGIKVELVSPQNEPGYSGTYPTCAWDPTAYASFVGKHLGPALSDANLSVKIMLGTFNGGTGDTDIVSTVMGDATAKGYVKVIGFQWAMDGNIASAKQYGVPIWQTEHKCGNYPWETYDEEKAPNDQAYAVESWGLIRDWIKKGVTSYSTWNVVLDTVGNGIDSARVWPQNALLAVDTSAKKLIITPTYYVFRHFSQFVKPGAKVVGTTGGDAVAFKNSDGSIVTVLYNKEEAEKTMTVAAGGKKLQFAVPGAGWATVIAH